MAGKAADAAEEGFKATTTMLAVHGRAAQEEKHPEVWKIQEPKLHR